MKKSYKKPLLVLAAITFTSLSFSQNKIDHASRALGTNKIDIVGKSTKVSRSGDVIKAGECTPFLDCEDNDAITNVTFSTINNNSACGTDGYTLYSALTPALVNLGQPLPISVTVGDGWNSESVSIWIDYNHNGIFEDNEFTYLGTGSNSVVTGSVNVPSSANPGATLMRVRVAAVGSSSATSDLACDEDQGYGETEDYPIILNGTANCTTAPEVTIAINRATACLGDNIVLNATPATLGLNGLSYTFESSANNTDWTELVAASSATSTTFPAATSLHYRATVKCVDDAAIKTSASVQLTINPIVDCICAPILECGDGDNIENVTFLTINNTSTCDENTGYSDFRSIAAPTVRKEVATPISVKVGDGYQYEAVSVWIDYNQNGIFEDTEFTYVGVGSDEVVTGNITIPATALDGEATMRVRVAAVAAAGATSDLSCDEDQVYGETEDYKINIIPRDLAIGMVQNEVISIFPNPAKNNITVKTQDLSGAIQVEIIDLTGRIISTNAFQASQLVDGASINVSEVKTGKYLVRVSSDNAVHISNLVIQ